MSVVLGVVVDDAAVLSAAERAEVSAAAATARAAEERFREAFRRLSLPATHVRVTWHTEAAWCCVRVSMFDGRKVRKLWEGAGLEPLTTASREVLNAAKASRVKGIRAQAVVFHGWRVEGAPWIRSKLKFSDSEIEALVSALSSASPDLRTVMVVKPLTGDEFIESMRVAPSPTCPALGCDTWRCDRISGDVPGLWSVTNG